MINGFKLKIEASELRNLLVERVNYHRARAEQKQSELPQLKDAWERLKINNTENNNKFNNSTTAYHLSEDPTEQLEQDIKNHKQKANTFEFFANHLFMEETYTLDDGELRKLEIVR